MDELNKWNFEKITSESFIMRMIYDQIDEVLIDNILHLYNIQDVVLIVYDALKHRNIYHDQMSLVLKMVSIHIIQKYEINEDMQSKLDTVLNKSIELLFYKPNKHKHCKCCLYF
jgi:hypothetical protein